MTRTLMLMFVFFPLVVGTLTSCAARSPLQNVTSIPDISQAPEEQNRAPRLILDAYPRAGFAPLRVSIKAVLQNVPSSDPIFACMWESWSFGDGARSSEKSGCDGGTLVDLEYLAEHVYRNEGVYQIRFILGDNQVLSNAVQIRVIGQSY